MEPVYQLSYQFLQKRNQSYRRYFIQTTQLTERFSILIGQRGVGKTTTLIQYLLDYAEGNPLSPKILYVPSDHLALGNLSLYKIAEQFELHGGEFIAFDEIHKAPHWSGELKSIYDSFPQLKVLASGSSALEIHKGSHDLSRRALVYRIFGLSFREYLELFLKQPFPTLKFPDLLEHHLQHAQAILPLLGSHKILPLFKGYLKHGFYPYWFELNDDVKFAITLEQNIHTTLEADLVSIHPHLSGGSVKKLRQLLSFIAQNVPYSPNWKKLRETLDIGDERTLKTYFTLLEDAELLVSLYKSSNKLAALTNPEKIYLQNPNFSAVIGKGQENKGTLRETFLFSMVHPKHEVTLPFAGDFLIDQKIVLEVGGQNKDGKQIRDQPHAYVVCDDIEMGTPHKIPLWLFGFLY